MSFPIKMNVPQYVLTVPSTKEKASFRPFLVGEQKSMMLAIATEDTDTIVNAIKELVSICSNGKVSPDRLAPFDLEYLFLQLRSRSIGENVQLTVECPHCEESNFFGVDISKAEVDFTGSIDPKIVLAESIGVIMRYPTLAENIKLRSKGEIDDIELMNLAIDCIQSVWDADDFVNTTDHTREDVCKFAYSLTVPQMEMLTNFILRMPSIQFSKTITCKQCEKNINILVDGLENFFG